MSCGAPSRPVPQCILWSLLLHNYLLVAKCGSVLKRGEARERTRSNSHMARDLVLKSVPGYSPMLKVVVISKYICRNTTISSPHHSPILF